MNSNKTALGMLQFLSRRRKLQKSFRGGEVLIVRSNKSDGEIPRCSIYKGLFSPMPERLPSKENSALFSRFLVDVTNIPTEFGRKVLMLSKSILLLFGPLRVSTRFHKTTTVSVGSPMRIKISRKIFLGSKDSRMGVFLRGRPTRALHELKTIGKRSYISLSANTMLLSTRVLRALFDLVTSTSKGGTSPSGCRDFMGRGTEIDFCKSFLCPLTTSSAFRRCRGRGPRNRFYARLFVYERGV